MGCVGQVGALGPGGEAGGSGLFMLLSRGERACGARAGSAAAGGRGAGPWERAGRSSHLVFLPSPDPTVWPWERFSPSLGSFPHP